MTPESILLDSSSDSDGYSSENGNEYEIVTSHESIDFFNEIAKLESGMQFILCHRDEDTRHTLKGQIIYENEDTTVISFNFRLDDGNFCEYSGNGTMIIFFPDYSIELSEWKEMYNSFNPTSQYIINTFTNPSDGEITFQSFYEKEGDGETKEWLISS